MTSYRDLFKALVVEQPINNIEKFSHLRESLSDDPFILIKNVPVSETNFESAWNKLVSHYDNNKNIIYSHVNDLISIKPMVSESVTELRRVLNNTIDAVDSLEALEAPVQQWDMFLVPLTSQRLDHACRRDWETLTANKYEPVPFSDLKKFMQERLQTLEMLLFANSQDKEVKKEKTQGRKFDNSNFKSLKIHNLTKNPVSNDSKSSVPNIVKQSETKLCCVCSKPHFIAYCYIFKGKSSKEKLEFVKANKLCFNCLGHHHVKECKTNKTCLICAAKHHTLVHESLQASGVNSNAEPKTQSVHQSSELQERNQAVLSVTAHTGSNKSGAAHQDSILLGTAIVQVESKRGKVFTVRALVDPGAEISIVAESLVNRLKLPQEKCHMSISGIGDSNSKVSGISNLLLRSCINPAACYQVQAFVLDQITSYVPKCNLKSLDLSHLKGLKLADPNFSSQTPIELLLGVDVFQLIVQGGAVKSRSSGPVGQNTSLGWILTYSSSCNTFHATSHHGSCFSSVEPLDDDNITDILQKFWETESVPTLSSKKVLSPEDHKCEKHFQETFSRDESGRFCVKLPFKSNVTSYPGTFAIAKQALLRNEKRFHTNPAFRESYHAFMREYQDLAHMSKIGDETSISPEILE